MTHIYRTVAILVAALAFLTGIPSVSFAATTDPLLAKNIREGDVRFKVTCNLDRQLSDDPIVFPGQPGVSHQHDFFGKLSITASTTTYTQLVNGDDKTTCNDGLDMAAYWSPSLITSDQGIVKPSRVTGYYRRGSKNGLIGAYPDGLKIIAGYRVGYATPSTEITSWQCGEAALLRSATPPNCGSDHLRAFIRYPDCWDGVNADSADHRSHMAYSVYNTGAKANVCPSTHPSQVPQLTMYVSYDTVSLGSTVTGLSSGSEDTLHGDFFNGWDRARQLERIDTCLNKLARCESGG